MRALARLRRTTIVNGRALVVAPGCGLRDLDPACPVCGPTAQDRVACPAGRGRGGGRPVGSRRSTVAPVAWSCPGSMKSDGEEPQTAQTTTPVAGPAALITDDAPPRSSAASRRRARAEPSSSSARVRCLLELRLERGHGEHLRAPCVRRRLGRRVDARRAAPSGALDCRSAAGFLAQVARAPPRCMPGIFT